MLANDGPGHRATIGGVVIDLHVHTARCRHADGAIEDYVRAAASRGVQTLAFTDHLPLAPALASRVPGADGYAMPESELDEYMSDVARAAALGADLGVEVLCGIEADLVESVTQHARSLLAGRDFDLVLGSVHFIDGWAFDDPARTDRYAEWRPEDLWERYFSDLVAAARAGVADVIAHADLVKKFRFVPDAPVGHLYARAAEACAEAGVAVEVNTAGLRKPCRELYPSHEFLVALRRAGVPVTVGSDAHTPGDVGSGWEAAAAALEAAGYDSVLVYRNRRPQEVPLARW